MKNKCISISIILIFIFTSMISVEAIAPTPRIDLDEYQLTVTVKNSVYASGTLSICVGQDVGVYDSNGKIMYNCIRVNNSNKQGSFKVQVPSRYLSEGKNIFKIKSSSIKGTINGSNPKTLTIIVNSSKKDQIITANNLTLKVAETKNINASTNSGLPLTYLSDNPSIATVDTKGNVVGRKNGSTKITIRQLGNSSYNPASKVIVVTVSNSNTEGVKKSQSISTKFDRYQFAGINKSISLNAKASSGLKVTYLSSNSKIVTVDSKGKITAKSPGTANIIVKQIGNNQYKSATKNISINVPKIKSRDAALQPWYNALTEQIKWQKNAKYNWSKWRKKGGTVEASKYYGTCITLPSAALQRLSILPKGGFIAGVTSKSNRRKSLNYLKKSPGCITNMNVNSSIRTLAKKNKIQKGDILHSNNHTWVYMGPANSKKTKFVFWECGNSRKNSNTAHKHTVKRNPTIKWVNRINCYTVNTTCTNGTMTGSNLYMAGQNIKITYKPVNGKKLKSVKVDGKAVNIQTYKSSYTFKKLNKNHNIEVIFN